MNDMTNIMYIYVSIGILFVKLHPMEQQNSKNPSIWPDENKKGTCNDGK